jgi:hypothetical protein
VIGAVVARRDPPPKQGESDMMIARLAAVAVTATLIALPGCRSAPREGELRPAALESGKQNGWRPFAPKPKIGQIYASANHQLTGVAVSSGGRVFVNFPRWDATAGAYAMAVGEVGAGNTIKAYPPAASEGESWNRFNADPRTPPRGDCFVCVQSVHVDGRDRLWVLDPASPLFAGVIRGEAGGGPKLVEIDLKTDRIVRVIRFDEKIAPEKSYLNDVRVELLESGDFAYITDSGLGAIIVVDLTTNKARRLLDGHESTRADASFTPVIGGRPWRGGDGKVPQIHSDGIALDQRGGYLYWQALTGKRLFGCATAMLRDAGVTAAQLDGAIRDFGQTVMTDGMECDENGVLYFSALEQDAIVVRTPDGELHTLVSDPAIAWPDSFALSKGRMPRTRRPQPLIVFTTAQIHRSRMFSADGQPPREPYRVLATPAWRKAGK